MVANPLTAQIAPAAVESFAGQPGRRPAGPLFDALIAIDAEPAADPAMDSIRKGRAAAPAVFPWMLPLNPVPPAAPGSAEEAALATVAIAGDTPASPQAGPTVPAGPVPSAIPTPASVPVPEIRLAEAEVRDGTAWPQKAPAVTASREAGAVEPPQLLDAVRPTAMPEPPTLLRRPAAEIAVSVRTAPDEAAAEPAMAVGTPKATAPAARVAHAAQPGPVMSAAEPASRRVVPSIGDTAAPVPLHEPAAASRLMVGEPARPPPTAPSAEPRPPTPALQIVASLAKGQPGAPARLVVDLVPHDLGRVEIAIETEKRGGRARITADRRETLDLLVAEARVLEKALADAGVDLGRRGLEFTLRGEAGRGEGGRGREPQAPAERAAAPGGDLLAASSPSLAETTLPRSRTGLDILV